MSNSVHLSEVRELYNVNLPLYVRIVDICINRPTNIFSGSIKNIE